MNATFSINPEFSGIEITFPGKPSEEVRESLKSAGFRWHNIRRIWYAKQNPARLALAHALTGSTGSAENKENAEKWIDFLCKAEVAAQNFDYLYYTTPNEAALELIDEEYLKEKAVFPDNETIERCESLVTLDPDTTKLYSDYWKKVKAE
jgi:hypothetical protein